MGTGIGALKYFLATFLFPGPYYVFGGTILWFMDVLTILGARNFQELAVAAFQAYFDIPSSLGEFLFQHFIGGAVATLLWIAGMVRYASR